MHNLPFVISFSQHKASPAKLAGLTHMKGNDGRIAQILYQQVLWFYKEAILWCGAGFGKHGTEHSRYCCTTIFSVGRKGGVKQTGYIFRQAFVKLVPVAVVKYGYEVIKELAYVCWPFAIDRLLCKAVAANAEQ